jgi:peptidoglycan/LPS O-acetylase OafA/YrhL
MQLPPRVAFKGAELRAPGTFRHATSTAKTAAGWIDPRAPGRYIPALDGIRALAVASVVAYHLGFAWAGGGYLGVDVFFVLSGFLITSLLMAGRFEEGKVALRRFWGRRARRLLPALFLMLAVVSLAAWLDRRAVSLPAFRSDALATLFYVANWHEILANQSYFAQFSAPSPLEHTWSLAIEEQFYLLWPLAVALVATFACRGRACQQPTTIARSIGALAALLAVASALAMALGYHSPSDATAIYFSTFTRAFELLIGALLACLLMGRPAPVGRRGAILDAAGLLAIAALALVWSRAAGPPRWMFEGGFLLASLLAAVLIASAGRSPAGWLGRLLAVRPLRYLGRISYGIYLWHWPAIVLMTPSTTGTSGLPLDALRCSATLGASVISFYLVEAPLRRASYQGLPRRALLPVAVAATAVVILVATLPQPAASSAAALSQPTQVASSDLPARVAGGPFPFLPAPVDVSVPPSGWSPSSPLRVLVIGDSVEWTAEPALAAAWQSTGEVTVHNAAFVGWGLTRVVTWRQQYAELLSHYRPQLVVGTWSWDDSYALAHPDAYRRLLSSFVSYVLQPRYRVQGLVLLQFPPLGPLWEIDPNAARENPIRFAGVVAWNHIAEQVASEHPGRSAFLEVARSVEVHGAFSAWLPDGTGGASRARMVDNTHFCPWGAAVYAAAVTSSLDPVLKLPSPRGEWWSQSWTSDPRYAQANGFPGGACPDDQPPRPLSEKPLSEK